MNSRRDWLKCFGAGALIVPIIGAKADESQAAQLIEAPRIKPVELFASIPKPIDLLRDLAGVTVLLTLKDGTRRRFDIKHPEAWGGIDASTERIEIGFNELSSPLSLRGGITGSISL